MIFKLALIMMCYLILITRFTVLSTWETKPITRVQNPLLVSMIVKCF